MEADAEGPVFVAVLQGTLGPTARTEVLYAQPRACIHAAIGPLKAYVLTLTILYLQLVVPPVGMEEHALVHLTILTVSVPVGTQDPTARTEVLTQPRICMHVHVCVYVCACASMAYSEVQFT